jgi:hypothetical protein
MDTSNITQNSKPAQGHPSTHHHNGHGAGAAIIEEFEAREAAVTTFIRLLEEPGLFALDPDEHYLPFGPYLEPIETVNSTRIQANPGQELEAAHQAVEAHWETWQAEPRLAPFVAAVERRWLRTYRATELLHKTFPARRWIVPGHLSEGLGVIAGKSGIGKGWWALQLGIAVAQGGKAFGEVDVAVGDVLYLSLEDDAPQMQERFARLIEEGEPYPPRLTIAHEAPLLSQGLAERLETWLRSQQDPRLIIIDTLQKIRPPQRQNGNVYEQDYLVIEALKPLAHRYHVAILLLHHTNKRVDPADPLDAISGSTGLQAPADIKGVFARARGDADAKLFLTGRSIREGWRAFRFTEGLWEYLGDAEEAERSGPRQAIIAVLRQQSGPMTPKTIAATLGRSENAIYFLLHQMVKDGEVKKVARGWYTAPPPPLRSSPPPPAKDTKDAKDTKIAKDAKDATETPPPAPILSDPEPVAKDAAKDETASEINEQEPILSNLSDLSKSTPIPEGKDENPPPTPADDHPVVEDAPLPPTDEGGQPAACPRCGEPLRAGRCDECDPDPNSPFRTLNARPPVPDRANGRPRVINRNDWTYRTLEQARADREACQAALRAAGQQPTHCCRCQAPLQAGQYQEILEHGELQGECWDCIKRLS